jgi:hypothetical protein
MVEAFCSHANSSTVGDCLLTFDPDSTEFVVSKQQHFVSIAGPLLLQVCGAQAKSQAEHA